MKNTLSRITSAVVFVAAGMLSQTASAQTFPSILGVFSGTFSGQEFDCRSSPGGPIVQPGPFADTLNLTLTFTDQQGSNFTATGTTGEGDVVDVSGEVFANGDVLASFTFTESDGVSGSGSMSGTLVGDTLSLSIAGTDTAGPPGFLFCDFTYTGTMTRSASANPAFTAPSNITTSTALNTFVRFFSQSLSRRFNVFRSGVSGGASPVANGVMLQQGLSAGDGARWPVGVWGSWSRTDSKDDSAARTFSSDRDQFLGGVDVSPREDLLVGVAFGYETTDVDTPPNGGRQDIDGYTVAPYAAILLNDMLSADVSFGVSSIDNDQSRLLGATTLRSSVDSTRTFAAGNLSLTRSYGPLTVTGLAGALYARDRQDDFTESDATGTVTVANASRSFKIGQFRFGLEGAYAFGEFEPYLGATLEHDFTVTSTAGARTDRTGGVIGGGVRYFGADNGLTGSVDYQSVVGRRALDEGVFSVNLRMDF